jgi:hypothetical protein
MHHRSTCGNCGSTQLLQVPATPSSHSHITFGDRVLHTVGVDTYVCTDCGSIEQWVNSRAELNRLKEEYVRGTDAQ